MSSLDGIFTLQPEELFANTTLDQISHLSDAEAIALLPRITTLLAQEAAAWADHCTIVQSKSYTNIVGEAHARGTDVESIKAMAIHYVLATLPTRFAVLARLNRCESLQPLSETLKVLRDEVSQDRARGSAVFGVSYRRFVYDQAFAAAITEQEAILTDLENLRMDQLRKMRMMLLGASRLAFTSMKHVATFVGVMEELGIKIEGILPEASAEEA
jgi:hypothetical protein